MDFGYVVYGLVAMRTAILANTGHCPVSFTTAHAALEGTGFSVDLGDKVRSLPGAPDFEVLEFVVRFDPAAVKCSDGPVEAVLPFNVRLELLPAVYHDARVSMIPLGHALCM